MIVSDPRFLYVLLVLPSVFGITLCGDGFWKITHGQKYGLVSIIVGVVVFCIVISAYTLFVSLLK